MKAAFLTEPGNIVVKETDYPVLNPNDILVKIAYCGVCTLEQRLFTGDRKIYYPIIPGHEASGVIVEIGSEVKTHHAVGDHVALDLVNRCHICPACLSGNSNMCENRFKKGQRVLGAFSQYMAVRPDQAFVIPSSVPLSYAAFSEPIGCCIRSLKKTALELGDSVLIIGAGAMGMLHMKVASLMGATVFIADIDKKRLEDAKAMGANATLDASNTDELICAVKDLTAGRGVDVCIITTPAHAALETAVKSIAVEGRINVYTSYNDKPELPLDMNSLHRMEAMVTGSEGRNEKDFFQATKIIANGRISVDDLISAVYPLSQAKQAIEAALRSDTYRVLIALEE